MERKPVMTEDGKTKQEEARDSAFIAGLVILVATFLLGVGVGLLF